MRRRFVSTAPPPRRGSRRPPASIGSVRCQPVSPAPPRAASTPASPGAGEQDGFNAPLYTLKAFAISTAIVMSAASASVVGVMAYLDVHNTSEFAARMHTWVSQSMPLLTTKIYRRPTPCDSVPGDPVLLAASSPQCQPATSTTFDHDAAQQRLAEAFDKGGFDTWAEAAAREMEAETEVERHFRKHTTT